MTQKALLHGLWLSRFLSVLGIAGPSRPPEETSAAHAYCERCGNRMPEGAAYCPRCGAPVEAAPSAAPPTPAAVPPAYPPNAPPPYYGPSPPPRQKEFPIVLVVILVVVVLVSVSVIMAAIMYMITSSLVTSPGSTPKAIGIAMSRSADGTNWTLTFASVPSGLSPSTTGLTLLSANGTSLLDSMPLSALPGGLVNLSDSAGMLYVQYQGVTLGSVSAGDVLRIGTTFAVPTTSTTGYGVQIESVGTILYSGTLQ